MWIRGLACLTSASSVPPFAQPLGVNTIRLFEFLCIEIANRRDSRVNARPRPSSRLGVFRLAEHVGVPSCADWSCLGPAQTGTRHPRRLGVHVMHRATSVASTEH